MGDVERRSGAIRRRTVLEGMVGLGAAAAGPWIVSPRALASSGEVNVLMWSGYLSDDFLAAFTKDTGITVNYTRVDSNEEILNKMKATKGRGIDICSPTNMRSPQWAELGLLQPFDFARLTNLGNVSPAMLDVGRQEWSFGGDGSHWVPHIWGTEAVTWRTDLYEPPGGTPSYGNIWDPANRGKTMIRPHSGMLGAGLYLETTGALEPGAMKRAYDDEVTMRATWEKVTRYCIENKAQVKLFWNDANTQRDGLLNQGVVVGQSWDWPPLTLKTAGEPVAFQAPKEGALAWIDGMALSHAAADLDATYAFLDFCFDPSRAGMAIDAHGYNSAVLGADRFAGPSYKKNFAEAYPGDALANLWPWPREPQWYHDVRTEYRNRFFNA